MDKKNGQHNLGHLSDEELLQLKICDIPLSLDQSPFYPQVKHLRKILLRRGIQFFPHIWFSTEWFCPENYAGFAIPFYLAHPRLLKLAIQKQVDIEGHTRASFAQLLRHECGHAIEHFYNIQNSQWRIEFFGSTKKSYPASYDFLPYSKAFVRHLPDGYAQSHPDEDFAETFAVWLTPKRQWRKRYKNWKALDKLEAMNANMKKLAQSGCNFKLKTKNLKPYTKEFESISNLNEKLNRVFSSLPKKKIPVPRISSKQVDLLSKKTGCA